MTPEDIKYAASIFTLLLMAIIIILTVVFIWLVSRDDKDETKSDDK
jgi:hypothetical protein